MEDINKFFDKIKELLSQKECMDKNYIRKPVNESLKNKIIEKQNKKCFLCLCNTTMPLIHHIKPDKESTEENLVMLCPLCHQFIHWILNKYLGYRGTAFKRW